MTPVEKASAATGGGTFLVGSITADSLMTWVGVGAAALTFIFSQFWNWRRDKREERKLKYEMGQKEDRRTESMEVSKERRE